MTTKNKSIHTHNTNITVAEVLFGILLGIGSIGAIWASTTLLIRLLAP